MKNFHLKKPSRYYRLFKEALRIIPVRWWFRKNHMIMTPHQQYRINISDFIRLSAIFSEDANTVHVVQNKRENMKLQKNAFTLIELLIVVAIIGILAAIAVPNFLNAQIRAKVSRVYSDMRSLSSAIEMYKIDNNAVPYPILPEGNTDWYFRQVRLTTPIAYINSLPLDPFFLQQNRYDQSRHDKKGVYDYVGREYAGAVWGFTGGSLAERADFFIRSPGPDGGSSPTPWTSNSVYDSSNGLTSFGDIFYIDFHPGQ